MYNPFSLEGKTILVTGASSGIGRASAIECSKMGGIIIACGRNKDRLSETLDMLNGSQHSSFIGDLTDDLVVDKLVDEMPSVDGVVLSAGRGFTSPLIYSNRKSFQDVFNSNFFSNAEVLRLLAKKRKLKPNSSVVIIVSIGGTTSFGPGNSVYGTAKAALDSLIRYAAIEFSNKKIRVNGISPGMTETPLIQGGVFTKEQLQKDMMQYPLKRYGQPEEIAKGAVYLLSDAASWVTGHTLVIDGGFSAK